MKATLGLEHIGTYYTPKPFKIRELLPSEKSEGEYMFSVKNGRDDFGRPGSSEAAPTLVLVAAQENSGTL
jgi:hypothetical protein